MNIYDLANNLAYEMRNTQEYIKFKRIKEDMKENPVLQEKLDEFEKTRYKTQIATMKGEEPSKEIIEEMQRKYVELINDEKTKEYLDKELEFNTMLSNINKILSDAVKDII
jgi:cell fate (sporulation/competence/biofilm development) regulator YlbF (YheA/YmcA/DUF963 family)